MTSSFLTDLLVGLALVAYLGSRQLTWRPAGTTRDWRLPVVLGAVGVVSMAQHTTSLDPASWGPADLVVLVLTAVAALASGVAMGRIARFRAAPSAPGVVESRTGWLGVGLWIGLIAVRVLLGLAGHRFGSDLAASTGMILLAVALNRAASSLVISARLSRRAVPVAGR